MTSPPTPSGAADDLHHRSASGAASSLRLQASTRRDCKRGPAPAERLEALRDRVRRRALGAAASSHAEQPAPTPAGCGTNLLGVASANSVAPPPTWDAASISPLGGHPSRTPEHLRVPTPEAALPWAPAQHASDINLVDPRLRAEVHNASHLDHRHHDLVAPGPELLGRAHPGYHHGGVERKSSAYPLKARPPPPDATGGGAGEVANFDGVHPPSVHSPIHGAFVPKRRLQEHHHHAVELTEEHVVELSRCPPWFFAPSRWSG